MMIDDFSALCYDRSRTMKKCLKYGDITLGEFIRLQAEKVKKNRMVSPLTDPEDYFARLEEFAGERLGETAAGRIAAAARLGTVCTADHHGGIYCAQTFQSDLLFGEILKELGNVSGAIPIMSGGQVELDSSTYARGLCLHSDTEKKIRVPFFSSRPAARTAYCAPAIDAEKLGRFRLLLDETVTDKKIKGAVLDFTKKVYESHPVLNSRSFEDQVTRIGAAVSEELFGENGTLLAYLEAERMTLPLLIKEIREKKTPLGKLLADEKAVALMKETRLSDGAPISDLLFKTADAKGRNIFLSLGEDHKLYGKDWRGNEVLFPADSESLASLLEEGSLIPGFFLIACAVFFERGITWMGGVFQTEYLPEWQECFAKLLSGLNMSDEAETVRKYDCSAYVCGPMYVLFESEGHANPAGVVELLIKKEREDSLIKLMRDTKLADAHLMGLAEMYADLTAPDERPEGWYGIIGKELYDRFAGNTL